MLCMHGQNINLPVCVCLCVRHTFCQLSYRSDPSTDFYSRQLKRCGFTQECAFWGSRWWIITFSGPKSPKPPFWGLNRHFKPNMWKIQTAISSDLCIRLTSNLTSSCGQQQRLRRWSHMVVKQFQDGGRPTFWKSIYCHISVKNHPIFMKFCIWTGWTSRDQKWKSCIGQTPSSTERISCLHTFYLFRSIYLNIDLQWWIPLL